MIAFHHCVGITTGKGVAAKHSNKTFISNFKSKLLPISLSKSNFCGGLDPHIVCIYALY